VEEIVQPFYARVAQDNETGHFISDDALLHHLKIRQTVFLIRFLTQPLEGIMPMVESSGAVHGRIRLDFGIFSRYFLFYADLVLAWLAKRGVEPAKLALWQAKLFALFGAMACTYGGEAAAAQVQAATAQSDRMVDLDRLGAMHPPEQSKIDAAAYIAQSGGLDTELVAELKELEDDARGAIDMEGALTPRLKEALVSLFNAYATALNTTFEFQDLGYALESLARLIQAASDEIEPEAGRRILLFLEAVVSDLSSWREQIFVLQAAPDIHYLDASLFSSCAQLETLFLPGEEAEDETADLELF
jgi:hypothetical protein